MLRRGAFDTYSPVRSHPRAPRRPGGRRRGGSASFGCFRLGLGVRDGAGRGCLGIRARGVFGPARGLDRLAAQQRTELGLFLGGPGTRGRLRRGRHDRLGTEIQPGRHLKAGHVVLAGGGACAPARQSGFVAHGTAARHHQRVFPGSGCAGQRTWTWLLGSF